MLREVFTGLMCLPCQKLTIREIRRDAADRESLLREEDPE